MWDGYTNKKYILVDIVGMISKKIIQKHKTVIYTFILIEILLFIILTSENYLSQILHNFWITYTVTTIAIALVLLRYSMDVKTKDENKNLSLVNQKLKSIIDSQNSLIVIVDNETMIEVNAKVLEFFGFSSLEEMQKHNQCKSICERFVRHKDYFHLGLVEEEKSWIECLKSLPEKEQIVNMIGKDMEAKAFQTKINKYDSNNNSIITFSDITDIIIEQKLLEHKAQHDKLTSIYNRQKIDEVLIKICQFSSRRKEEVSVVIFDIDHFKNINDTYGHDIGDEVLINLANLIKDKIRDEDVFGRWGGEEFILIMRHANLKDAYNKAKRLKVTIEENTPAGLPKITASFGVTTLEKSDTPKTLLKRADVALYDAKHSGRNCVVKSEASISLPS